MGRKGAIRLLGLAGAAAVCAFPAVADAATGEIAYGGSVRATGRLVVTFTGGGVTGGTITWTPPAHGALLVLSGGGNRKWLRTSLDLAGTGATTTASIHRTGSDVCTDTARDGEDVELPVVAAGPSRLRFAWFAGHVSSLFAGSVDTPLDQAFRYVALGPQPDQPAPTHCGGPLPGDFLRLLPARSVDLRSLIRGRTSVDLSGTARFSAGGLTGTVTSTVAIRIAKLRGSAFPGRQPRVPPSQEDRVLYLHYRIARVSGTIGVNFSDAASTCAAFDACRMSGTVGLRLGPGRGSAEVIVYQRGVSSSAALRRSVGLAPGRAGGVQIGGLGSWTGPGAAISETVERDGSVACRGSNRLPVAGIEINVTGRRAAMLFGATDGLQLLTPNRDLLRTRCPGPTMSDLSQGALAQAHFPARWLGRPTLTVHLTRGATLSPVGFGAPSLAFTWQTHPDLTIVLRRTAVTEKLLPDADFET